MSDHDDFKTLRRYESHEVVEILRIKKTWLKRWVTARLVPHQRSGKKRGVWFTYDDILAIGRKLPQLMSGNQANRRAEAADEGGEADRDDYPEISASVTDHELADFASLISLRA